MKRESILKKHSVSKIKIRQMTTGILFTLVSLVGFSIFFAVPFFISVLYSFSSTSGVFNFSGISNYVDLISSPAFMLAAVNTLKFTVIGLPLLLIFAMCMALMLKYLFRRKMPGISVWFALSLTPMVVPSATVILFVQVLFERYGVVNGLLVNIGAQPIDFLNSEYSFGF